VSVAVWMGTEVNGHVAIVPAAKFGNVVQMPRPIPGRARGALLRWRRNPKSWNEGSYAL
jgi:hypothetical protein